MENSLLAPRQNSNVAPCGLIQTTNPSAFQETSNDTGNLGWIATSLHLSSVSILNSSPQGSIIARYEPLYPFRSRTLSILNKSSRSVQMHDESRNPERLLQHFDVHATGDVDSAGVDVVEDDFGGTEEQGVDLVEVSARRLEDIQKRLAVH